MLINQNQQSLYIEAYRTLISNEVDGRVLVRIKSGVISVHDYATHDTLDIDNMLADAQAVKLDAWPEVDEHVLPAKRIRFVHNCIFFELEDEAYATFAVTA